MLVNQLDIKLVYIQYWHVYHEIPNASKFLPCTSEGNSLTVTTSSKKSHVYFYFAELEFGHMKPCRFQCNIIEGISSVIALYFPKGDLRCEG